MYTEEINYSEDSNVTTHLSDLARSLRSLFSAGFWSGEGWELGFLSCQFLHFLVTYRHVDLACGPASSNEWS